MHLQVYAYLECENTLILTSNLRDNPAFLAYHIKLPYEILRLVQVQSQIFLTQQVETTCFISSDRSGLHCGFGKERNSLENSHRCTKSSVRNYCPLAAP